MKSLVVGTIAALALAVAPKAVAENAEWPQTNFAWGADVASSIDMTGQDLSTFNISAQFGYKNNAIEMLGAGGEIDIAVGNSNRLYPVFAIIRTSFVPGPMRCFFEAKAGYGFNNMNDGRNHDGIYGSAALGVNLAMGRNFRSHIVVGYTYRQLVRGYKDLSAVTAGIGINF